jgi:hypothetical protein
MHTLYENSVSASQTVAKSLLLFTEISVIYFQNYTIHIYVVLYGQIESFVALVRVTYIYHCFLNFILLVWNIWCGGNNASTTNV